MPTLLMVIPSRASALRPTLRAANPVDQGRTVPAPDRPIRFASMTELAGPGAGLSGELLTSVVNAAPDGILLVDADGVIQLANPMAGRIFGYAEDELIGQPVDML